MDRWSKAKRSEVMAKIKCYNTSPELEVRKMLRFLGYRYRLHNQKLPGRPDIILKRLKAIIFVHGCFWHLHFRCKDGTIPKSHTHYWKEKLLRNKARDAKHIRALRKQGWRVLRLWECEVEKKPDKVLALLNAFLTMKLP